MKYNELYTKMKWPSPNPHNVASNWNNVFLNWGKLLWKCGNMFKLWWYELVNGKKCELQHHLNVFFEKLVDLNYENGLYIHLFWFSVMCILPTYELQICHFWSTLRCNYPIDNTNYVGYDYGICYFTCLKGVTFQYLWQT
jgi:hypothetical protein